MSNSTTINLILRDMRELPGNEHATPPDDLLALTERDLRAILERYISPGVWEIADERRRQNVAEGWTPEHDDEHDDGEMAKAGATYAYLASFDTAARRRILSDPKDGLVSIAHWMWPRRWGWDWFKPKDQRTDLRRGGALIAAEIDRLRRAEQAAA